MIAMAAPQEDIRVTVLGVYRVRVEDGREGDVVFLLDEHEKTVLPIWIGENEALSIQIVIRGERPPRPLTHDLLVGILEATGNEVEKVRIDGLIKDTYTATIYIRNLTNNRVIKIDSRPSDAIAVALRVGCEILVDKKLKTQMMPKDRFRFPEEDQPTGGR